MDKGELPHFTKILLASWEVLEALVPWPGHVRRLDWSFPGGKRGVFEPWVLNGHKSLPCSEPGTTNDWIWNVNSDWFQVTGEKDSSMPWPGSSVCHGTGWGQAAHLPHARPPETLRFQDLSQPLLPHREDALPPTRIQTLCIQSLVFYVLTALKQAYTNKSALFPANSLLDSPPSPRAILVTVFVPCLWALGNPQLTISWKSTALHLANFTSEF